MASLKVNAALGFVFTIASRINSRFIRFSLFYARESLIRCGVRLHFPHHHYAQLFNNISKVR